MNMITKIHARPQVPAVARILSRYDREQVEAFVEIAIAMLDTLDGDPDAQDCADAEDDFAFTGLANAWRAEAGPGCPIADIDKGADDDGEAQCTEDEISCGGEHRSWRDASPGCPISDPGGQCDEDDLSAFGIAPSDNGAGCPFSDTGMADNGGLQEAHGVLDTPPYGIDQTRSLGAGHEVGWGS